MKKRKQRPQMPAQCASSGLLSERASAMCADQCMVPASILIRRFAVSLVLALTALLLWGGALPAFAQEDTSYYLIDGETQTASLDDETDFDDSDGSVVTPTVSLDQSAVVNENADDSGASPAADSEGGAADEADEADGTGISTLTTPSINTTSVTIYGLDTWEEDLISIPDDYAASFQLEVTGASSVSYSVTSGDAVTVSSTGLIEGAYTTWYWSGGIGTTWEMGDYDKITVDGDYGSATIKVTADGTTFTVNVEFVDYGEVYAEQVMQDYIDENITSSMSTYEKVEAMCAFVAGYDYSSSYSSAQGMILSGGGDCWSSTSAIITMSEMLGLEAWSRNGNRDSGAGSGHMNALVKDPDVSSTYYEAEAGYDGTAPRYYSVTTRTSLFSYRSVSGGIEVYQYDGNEDEEGTLTVPSTIDGYTVVSIGEYFIQGEDWDGVSLPDTITNIDAQAFYYCTSLTDITLPAGLETIGDFAICYCTSLEAITIPAGVTDIGAYNFMDCTALTAITVDQGNAAYSSSDGVLYSADGLTLIAYPENKSGTSFTVPDSVTTIGEGAFYKAQNLVSVTLPGGLTTIEDLAFQNADALTGITIPSTVAILGTQAFTYCDSLTTVSLSEGLTTINGYVFYQCPGLTSITIPSTVTSIGNYAFYGDKVMTITFTGDAPGLGTNVFRGLTLTACYPCSNSTWTSEVTEASYGESSATWVKNHTFESGRQISGSTVTGTCSVCGESITQTLVITLSVTSCTYDGTAHTPAVTVTADGTELTEGTDYTVSCSDNISAGTATVTVTGTGNYTGTATANFTITARSLSDSDVSLACTDVTYDGTAHTPAVTVTADDTELTEGTDYTVSYSDNVSAGTATVTVTGTGNYTGTATANFTITAVLTRLAGLNRYETMAEIVAGAYAGETSEWAVIATGTNFADALAAASLAGVLDAPIVLVSDSKVEIALEVLDKLGVKEAYIVGGTAAVSTTVQSQVEALGITVERLSGANRYETAIAIAAETNNIQTSSGGETSDTCIVASGASFPDALSGSPYAYWSGSPIYLAKADGSLSEEMLTAIREGGYSQIIVLGGTSAVSAGACSELEALGGTVTRLGGSNRYETSALVASWSVTQGMSFNGAAVATGTDYPDALAGATICGRFGSVILLTKDGSTAALELLTADDASVSKVCILGGTAAVSESIEKKLADLLGL